MFLFLNETEKNNEIIEIITHNKCSWCKIISIHVTWTTHNTIQHIFLFYEWHTCALSIPDDTSCCACREYPCTSKWLNVCVKHDRCVLVVVWSTHAFLLRKYYFSAGFPVSWIYSEYRECFECLTLNKINREKK